jgi:hypothetical protein
MYRQRMSLSLDAPHKYTSFIGYMFNYNDIQMTKLMINTIGDCNNFKIIYHTFGSPGNGKLKNPLGEYSKLEFLECAHFFAYGEEYIKMVPDGSFTFTSSRSCQTRFGTNMIIGAFIYKGTLLKSRGNLEQYYVQPDKIKIERVALEEEEKEGEIADSVAEEAQLKKQREEEEHELFKGVSLPENYFPGYFSSDYPLLNKTGSAATTKSWETTAVATTDIAVNEIDLETTASLFPITREDKSCSSSCSLREETPFTTEVPPDDNELITLSSSSSSLPVPSSSKSSRDSSVMEEIPFHCVGSMTLTFDSTGRIHLLEFFNQFL